MKIKIIALVFFLMILAVTACTPKEGSSDMPVVKIGISTLLSGEFAGAGDNIVKSAEIAAEEVPHEGFEIKFVVEDAGCGAGKGLTAAVKLIEVDEVEAIVGGTCSDDTMAAAPYVNEQKVVYITPVTGGTNIDNAGEYVFRTGNADVLAGIQPAEDFVNLFGYKSAVLMTENREYTIDIKDNFKKRFEEKNGEVLMDEVFEPDETDFRTLILKTQEKDPDAILLSSQLGTTGLYFIKQAYEVGMDIPIFTTFTTVVNENAENIAGEALNGVYFYDPDYDDKDPDYLEFLEKYKEKYGKDPLIPFHAAATYDTTRMIIEAINEVGNDGEKIHDWLLANIQDWNGFMGTLSFDEKGNTDSGFELKVVQYGEFVRYSEDEN